MIVLRQSRKQFQVDRLTLPIDSLTLFEITSLHFGIQPKSLRNIQSFLTDIMFPSGGADGVAETKRFPVGDSTGIFRTIGKKTSVEVVCAPENQALSSSPGRSVGELLATFCFTVPWQNVFGGLLPWRFARSQKLLKQ